MGTADQLLEKIFSWIEENERCEKQLRKLARELESLREKCNAGQCVGNSVAVVGGICTIAGGVATLMTAGAAAPLLGLGALYSGVGGAISLSSDVIEIILSSEPMKEAQKAAKKSAKIENEIQQLFKKLKMERNRMNSSADLDELDRHVVIEIIKAIARRKGLTVPITITHHTFKYMYNKREDKNFQMICAATLGILAVFAFKLGGTGLRSLYARGAEQINRLMSTAAYKRGAAVAQAIGMLFTLREAIDNWTDMIKKNHVTEASKSLRDKADEIKEVTQTLREQLDDIKRKLGEMDRRQQEEKRRHDQKRVRLGLGIMVVIGVAFLAFLVGNSRIKKVSHYDTSHYDTSHYETNHHETSQYETNHHETSQYETCQYETNHHETNHHETNHAPSGVIRLGLINARSINNKRCLIPEVITENNLSVLCITETWTRNDTADKVLRECLPPDFGCYNVSRNRKGGGAAVLFSKVFCSEQKEFGFITTFEYVATVLHHRQWDKPILLINVYRPPGYKKFKDFLSEFQMLLNEVQGSNLVVTGDFNIRVDRVEDRYAKLLEELLQRNDLDQYVNSKTHQKGGTLDLVISRNVEISDVHVSNELISDHYPVFFNAKPVSKNTGKKIKDDRDEDEQGKRFKKCEE